MNLTLTLCSALDTSLERTCCLGKSVEGREPWQDFFPQHVSLPVKRVARRERLSSRTLAFWAGPSEGLCPLLRRCRAGRSSGWAIGAGAQRSSARTSRVSAGAGPLSTAMGGDEPAAEPQGPAGIPHCQESLLGFVLL